MVRDTTGERMARIETKMDSVEKGMGDLKNSLKGDVQEIKDSLKDHLKVCRRQFAGKWTETISVGSFLVALAIIATLVISYFGGA